MNNKRLISGESRYPPDFDCTESNVNVFQYSSDLPGDVKSNNKDDLSLINKLGEYNYSYGLDLDLPEQSLPDQNPRRPLANQSTSKHGNYDFEEKLDDMPQSNMIQHMTLNQLMATNTLNYDVLNIGCGKEFISGASGYPPELDLDNDEIYALGDVDILDTTIINNFNYDINCEKFISGSTVNLVNVIQGDQTVKLCNICSAATLEYTDNYYDDQTYSINNINLSNAIEASEIIPAKLIKWWINVPVRLPDGKKIWVRMLADTGANAGCIDTRFAVDNFKQRIYPNSDKCTLNTPGGKIVPAYCVYFAFPLKSGEFLRAKLYMVNNLPVPVICDLNMLLAFGYRFKNYDIPPIFKHESEPDIDLDLIALEDQFILNQPIKPSKGGNDSGKNVNKVKDVINIDKVMDYSTLTYTYNEYKASKLSKFKFNENQEVNQVNNTFKSLPICEQIGSDSEMSYHYALGSVTPAPSTFSDNFSINERLDAFTDVMIRDIKNSNEDYTVSDIMSEKTLLNIVKDDKLSKLSNDILSDPSKIDDILDITINNINTQNDLIDEVNSRNVINSQIKDTKELLRINKDISSLLKGKFGDVLQEQPPTAMHGITDAETADVHTITTNYSPKNYGIKFSSIKNNLSIRKLGNLSNINFNIIREPRLKQANFILANQSYLATEDEIKEAQSYDYNPYLKHNDISYLKEYPSKYGERFKGLYEETIKLRDEFEDVFAKREYDRRTMNVPPVRLGILPQYRNQTCYAPQYPLTKEQRRYMINYTIEGVKNGFWRSILSSLHCLPHTMVAKRDKNGKIIKMRPAFDARIINAICELFPAIMPTIKDFDDLFSIKGFFTLADIKNMFNNIPLDKRDWLWAVVLTPLGLYQMLHLEYGFKNAAQNAQNIMNIMCLHIILMIVFIDDILLKHYYYWGTTQLIAHQRKFLMYCREKNILLNPTKYWPFVSECVNFGYKRTLEGSTISNKYKLKVIKFAKPSTVRQMKEFLGIIGYIARYIYHGNKISYWLNQLTINLPDKHRLEWTRQANTAYAQILYLVDNAPILHNPTKSGTFCIKCDASTYGAGAVLYQEQMTVDNQTKWVIIDMHSSQTPERLRHAHAMVHEARAVVLACQHWLFHLIKKPFIIATDNKPVSQLFTEKYRKLNDTTQKQILRLRVAITPLSYQMRHVEGLKNLIADGLSRFTMLLTDKSKDYADLAEAILPKDVKGDKLSDEQIKELMRESQLLRQQQREISENNNIVSLINMLPDYESDLKKVNYINKLQDKEYHEIKAKYYRSAITGEKERLKDILFSANHANVLISDEYNFNTTPINNLYQELDILQSALNGMTEDLCNQVCNITNQVLDQCQLYDNIVSAYDTTIDDIITDEFKDDYNSDIDIIHEHQVNVQTRSMTKQKQRKIYRVDYIPPEYNSVNEHLKVRSEFMHDLYGYRANTDIFSLKHILSYQKSDIELARVRYIYDILISNGYNFQDSVIQKDLEYLKEKNDVYYLLIVSGRIMIDKESKLIFFSVLDKELHKEEWRIAVPVVLRGQYMDWAHHNINSQHLHYSQTYVKLSRTYYWDNMEKDIKRFCERCLICDFVKGSKRHRAPLNIRQTVRPREHIMFDFIGSIYGKYYILAIIDYCTGYTMLIPTTGTDVQHVVDAIIHKWIPIFGRFKYLDCDYGPSFNAKVFRAVMEALKTNVEYCEPKNHRAIGKVERVIGFVQSIIQRYNIMLDERLTDSNYEKRNWLTLKTIIPHIQATINQRRPRFTTFSPNMLMFGSNVHDLSDINAIQDRLENIYKNKSNYNPNNADYIYMQHLLQTLRKIYRSFNEDWKKYVYLSKQQYDKRYNINEETIKRNRQVFIEGTKVLYFIGDQYTTMRKWRRKWTGPWVIKHILNDSTVIIMDSENGNQKRVSINRLKLFRSKNTDLIPYKKYINQNGYEFDTYHDKLKEFLYNTSSLQTDEAKVNLDYRDRMQ